MTWLTRRDLKVLARSGSWRFMRDARPSNQKVAVASLQWRGHAVHYRPGTSDCPVMYEILLKPGSKAEYALPDAIQPRVIYDIGGNIGLTSIYFANRFPEANIHVFEPVPANYQLLQNNIAPYPRVRAHQVALGASDGELDMFGSDNANNFGGFSFFDKGVDRTKRTTVVQCHAQRYIDKHCLPQPDLIKIDTEGAEHAILSSLDAELLARVQWIIGELHGERDFELLAHLSQWFDIGMRKAMNRRLFIFNAGNRCLKTGSY
ncbi:MAG: FkbM family methyltransferase [Burkholderiales bacterium]